MVERILKGDVPPQPLSPDYGLEALIPPDDLKGLPAAVDHLKFALGSQSRILIVGDYDADGATSVALMVEGLRLLGAAQVDYLIPDRFNMGYGLSPRLAELALTREPDLVITVDQGIVSFDGVKLVKRAGKSIIVTDHHLPGDVLPEADAIVNPNQAGCAFQSKCLAGVGVAFYVLIGLRAALRSTGSGLGQVNLAQLLDLVALGTIADLVPLDENNRRLVQSGIERIRKGLARPGLLALLDVAGLDPSVVTSTQLAFNVAPRLNAAGRLEDMSEGVACLLADADVAPRLAQKLDDLNRTRRDIEQVMQIEAQAGLDQLPLNQLQSMQGISVFEEAWHEGVVGILAARLRSRYNRPVFAFAKTQEGLIKGSGRSVEGLHLRDLLAEIDADRQGLLLSFGGHAMAAGVTLREQDFETFCACFDEFAAIAMKGRPNEETLLSEGMVPRLDLKFAIELVRNHPWGQGFSAPVFDERFEILTQRRLKGGHLKLQLYSVRFAQAVDAIYFGQDREIEAADAQFAYRLDVNRFRGVDRMQLQVLEVWL